jgi:hypothetical protein
MRESIIFLFLLVICLISSLFILNKSNIKINDIDFKRLHESSDFDTSTTYHSLD